MNLADLAISCPECGYEYARRTDDGTVDHNGDLVISFACELDHPFRLRIHFSKGQELIVPEKVTEGTTSIWYMGDWPKVHD